MSAGLSTSTDTLYYQCQLDYEDDFENYAIRQWMIENNMGVREEIYVAFGEEGLNTIADLKHCELHDLEELISLLNNRDEFAGNNKINFIEKKKLKNMHEILTYSNADKKHVVDTEEIHMFTAMKLQIKQFEDQLQKLQTKEVDIKQTEEQITKDINDTFETLISTLNERKISLLEVLDVIIQNKTQKIKAKMNEYETTLDELNTIKSNTQSILDKTVAVEQIETRKTKIETNKKSVDEIIEKWNEDSAAMNNDLFFLMDTELFVMMDDIGMISEDCVPLLQDLQYDDDIADDQIKLLWELKLLDEDETDEEIRKLCVEYICCDHMPDDMQNNENIEDIDEKEWISTDYDVDCNAFDGEVIIDLDPELIGLCLFRFKYYLKNNTIASPYSNIKSIVFPRIDSNIITDEETVILYGWIKEHILKDEEERVSLSLLYRMSRDGKNLKEAQSKFDHQGPTITLIQTKDYNNVCGGYASQSWCCGTSKFDLPTHDDDAFVFSLRSQEGNDPQIFRPEDPSKAIYSRNDGGPSWGPGCTLRIYLIDRYDVYAGADEVYNIKDDHLLLGAPACFMQEYEVYKVTIV